MLPLEAGPLVLFHFFFQVLMFLTGNFFFAGVWDTWYLVALLLRHIPPLGHLSHRRKSASAIVYTTLNMFPEVTPAARNKLKQGIRNIGIPPLTPSRPLHRRCQVNDWGWRMTVTPVMDKMDVATLPPPMLDSKLASLLRICRDCPKEQVRQHSSNLEDRQDVAEADKSVASARGPQEETTKCVSQPFPVYGTRNTVYFCVLKLF